MVEHQEPLADEPLVDAEASVQLPCTVIGDDEHQRIVAQQFQQAADLLIEVAIVVADDSFVRTVSFVQDVLGVVVLPESVLEAVQTDLDELEIIPVGRFEAGAAPRRNACGSSHRSLP